MSLLDDDSDEEEIRIERRRKSQKKTPSYKKRIEKIKEKSDFRNNNLDPNSSIGKRYITETVIKKYLGLKTCLDKTGNITKKGLGYNIVDTEEWGTICVKSAKLSKRGESIGWHFGIEKNKKSDFFFCIGYDKKRENIMMFLIIPNEDRVSVLDGLWVPTDGRCKWDAFRESKEEVKKLDDIFHSLRLEDCPILRGKDR
jgi:hypothetical protein